VKFWLVRNLIPYAWFDIPSLISSYFIFTTSHDKWFKSNSFYLPFTTQQSFWSQIYPFHSENYLFNFEFPSVSLYPIFLSLCSRVPSSGFGKYAHLKSECWVTSTPLYPSASTQSLLSSLLLESLLSIILLFSVQGVRFILPAARGVFHWIESDSFDSERKRFIKQIYLWVERWKNEDWEFGWTGGSFEWCI